jgi:hypothetical protein
VGGVGKKENNKLGCEKYFCIWVTYLLGTAGDALLSLRNKQGNQAPTRSRNFWCSNYLFLRIVAGDLSLWFFSSSFWLQFAHVVVLESNTHIEGNCSQALYPSLYPERIAAKEGEEKY